MVSTRSVLLLQSTVATLSGLALVFWPAASNVVLGVPSPAIRAFSVLIGGLLVFVGSLLCTVAGAANLAVKNGVVSGALVAFAAFAWFLIAPHIGQADAVVGGAKLSPQFLQAGAAYFFAAALLTQFSSTSKRQAAGAAGAAPGVAKKAQ